MKAEQFWEIIAEINAKVPDGSQEAMLRQAKKALEKLTLEELIAYDQIFQVYHSASFRQYLLVASTALGATCSEESFMHFRSWLISRGKQVYMDALRAPSPSPRSSAKRRSSILKLLRMLPRMSIPKNPRRKAGQLRSLSSR